MGTTRAVAISYAVQLDKLVRMVQIPPRNQRFYCRLTIGRGSRVRRPLERTGPTAYGPNRLLSAATAGILMLEMAKAMPKITFDVPGGALSALRLSPTEFVVKDMRVAASLIWYSRGELSQSKAAEVASPAHTGLESEVTRQGDPSSASSPGGRSNVERD